MNIDYNTIYNKVETHVTNLFNESQNTKLVYHNLEHTQKVVAITKEIGNNYNLIENDMLVLHIASWFHDTGYLFVEPALHEEKSVELMRDFMKDLIAEEDVLNNMAQCILATKATAKPVNLLQQILVDADTYNLGTDEFITTNEQVYKEYTLHNGNISKNEWDKRTLKFIENHSFYTTYCKELLSEKKKKNIKKITKNLSEMESDGAQAVI